MQKLPIDLNTTVFFAILILLTALCYHIISPFLIDIMLAGILVNLFYKPYSYLKTKRKVNARLASAIAVTITFFAIVMPFTLIGGMLLSQTENIMRLYENEWPKVESIISGDYFHILSSEYPEFDEYLYKIGHKTTEMMGSIMEYSADLIEDTFVDLGFILFHFSMVLSIMYFLFIDGKKLIIRVHELIPLSNKDDDELLSKVVLVSNAVIYGTFIIGIMEGVFGGLLFWICGISMPLFWGVVMFIFSMVPILGANGIIIPVALISIITGGISVWVGLVLIFVGFAGVSISQNFIKSQMVGNKMGMHEGVVLIATIGGIMWLGLLGFIIGPILMAVCIVTWEQMAKKYKGESLRWNKS